ncbi:sugar ABC transporter substrate-binding protein [Nocardioides campestrisoli]|uniref:sugar ABC transporter substrate-binding protein n=1 Tax=Nocardioides campestrisoli TaxID=2736757 RepID=UPI00163D5A43|nr:sugar ABC transporter substrate-binding protein [Nocardioides campestrisoli]
MKKFAALAATAALFLTACSSGADSSSSSGGGNSEGSGGLPQVGEPAEISKLAGDMVKGKKVVYAAGAAGFPLQEQWANTFKKTFPQLGIEFEMNEAAADPQKLVTNAQTLLNQDPDVLILHNQDLSNASSLIQQAQADGVYVILINLASVAQSDAFVGGDFVKAQAALAERMASDCDKKGRNKVAVITGWGSDGLSVQAVAAWQKVFDESGMEVVSEQAGQYDPTKAGDITKVVLKQHPDLCGFIGAWDSMMIGSANAVEQAGKAGEIGVYTSDASVVACEALENGSMTAALNYGVATMGDSIVSLVQYLLQSGRPAGSSRTAVYTRWNVIDKDTYKRDRSACYDGNVS